MTKNLTELTAYLKDVRANQPAVTLPEAQKQCARIAMAMEAAGHDIPLAPWVVSWEHKSANNTGTTEIQANNAIHAAMKFEKMYPDKSAISVLPLCH